MVDFRPLSRPFSLPSPLRPPPPPPPPLGDFERPSMLSFVPFPSFLFFSLAFLSFCSEGNSAPILSRLKLIYRIHSTKPIFDS